uniref:Uncharacterized protein n=1 Tax=Oryza glumipatula TaxID=40148 RepID=A0A0D9YU30_9ORYZ
MCVYVCACSEGDDGGEGVVLLLREGPEVPDGAEDEQGDGVRVLEGDGEGPGDLQGEGPRGHEKDARLLHREGPPRRQDRMGHARVPHPRQARRRQFQAGSGVGAVQGVQEEPRAGGGGGGGRQERRGRRDGRWAVVDAHGGRRRRPRPVRAPAADGRVWRRRWRRHSLAVSDRGRGGGAAASARDLLLQRAGGPVPGHTVPPPRRRSRGSPRHVLRLAVLGGPADAVRPGRRRRRRSGHGARAAHGRRLVLQQGREGEAERRLAGHRPHVVRGEPRRDLVVVAAATHGSSRRVPLGLLKYSFIIIENCISHYY